MVFCVGSLLILLVLLTEDFLGGREKMRDGRGVGLGRF
jgi:hypothetical protein